jgi:hypothetical protein
MLRDRVPRAGAAAFAQGLKPTPIQIVDLENVACQPAIGALP